VDELDRPAERRMNKLGLITGIRINRYFSRISICLARLVPFCCLTIATDLLVLKLTDFLSSSRNNYNRKLKMQEWDIFANNVIKYEYLVESKGFRICCITLWITGIVDIAHCLVTDVRFFWGTQQSNCLLPFAWRRKQILFPKRCFLFI
jgi:hypothetical protein